MTGARKVDVTLIFRYVKSSIPGRPLNVSFWQPQNECFYFKIWCLFGTHGTFLGCSASLCFDGPLTCVLRYGFSLDGICGFRKGFLWLRHDPDRLHQDLESPFSTTPPPKAHMTGWKIQRE